MTRRKPEPYYKPPEMKTLIVARFTPPKDKRPKPLNGDIRPIVTDHALVRYFERVLGLDVEAIRAGILTPEQEQQIKLGFAVELKLAPGVRAVIKHGHVVTIK